MIRVGTVSPAVPPRDGTSGDSHRRAARVVRDEADGPSSDDCVNHARQFSAELALTADRYLVDPRELPGVRLIEVTKAVFEIQVVIVERPPGKIAAQCALHVLQRLRKIVIAEHRQTIRVAAVHRDLQRVVPRFAERRVVRRQTDTVPREMREWHQRLPELSAGECRIRQLGQAEPLRVSVRPQNRLQIRPEAQMFRIELVFLRQVAGPDITRPRPDVPISTVRFVIT